MIQIETTPAFRDFMLNKRFRGQVRNLATSLITALRINPHGRELVSVCGQGGEADNCEAIFSWVKHEACCASCIKVLDFKALQRRFVRFLLENTNQKEYHE
ncbi:hypothetical protein MN202_16975 [Rheinheimera muenzenbergensis]|uniref:Uncharacterized protein n=1 Tax=Rheinheimera muenzenbergensis TaxID=1193628 RepID=A0ABU8CBS1_9GAMM